MKYKVLTMNNFYKNITFPSREIYGIYHSSDFSPIPGYNTKVFMVVFNLDHRYFSMMEHYDIEQYVRSCIDSLNKVPKNKRDNTPIFGQLTYFKSKVIERAGTKYIQVFALSSEKKNKMFFRVGDEVEQAPSLKERPLSLKKEEYAGDESAAPKAEEPKRKRGRPKKTEEQKLAQVAASWKAHADKEKRKRGRPAKVKKGK